MAKLSPAEIAGYAHDAGFRGHDLTVAVAVALAESGGDPKAHNAVPPDDSYGLWQINMLGALGPDRRREFNLDANRELFDPAANAKAAWAISGKGGSFRPWTTYTSGAYRKYLDEARAGIRKMGKKPAARTGGDDSDGFRVDPAALSGYATTTRRIADDLSDLAGRQLRGLTGDGFGRIGRETGFAQALEHFGTALRHQVKGVGANADTLADSVSRATRHYREQERDIADDLLSLLRRG